MTTVLLVLAVVTAVSALEAYTAGADFSPLSYNPPSQDAVESEGTVVGGANEAPNNPY